MTETTSRSMPLRRGSQSAVPSSILTLPLKHIESGNYFEQMLALDCALEALYHSRDKVKSEVLEAVTYEGSKCPRDKDGTPAARVYKTSNDQNVNTNAEADYDNIYQSLESINTLLRTFENLQMAARRCHAKYARSLLRGISITGLPTTELSMIFVKLGGIVDLGFTGGFEYHGSDINDIRNVRLTCRKFSFVASRFVVRRLNISLDTRSIEHLDRVARNPSRIGCQQIISIDLRYYRSYLAENFEAFAEKCRGDVIDNLKRLYHRDATFVNSTEHFVLNTKNLLDSWNQYAQSLNESVGGIIHAGETAVAFRKGHERYRKLFHRQQRLLHNGNFSRAVAGAAAASNSRIWLSMWDESRTPEPDCFQGIHSCSASQLEAMTDPVRLIHYSMDRPFTWRWERRDEAREIPQSLLYEIPLAMHTALKKHQLAGFDVRIHEPPQLEMNLTTFQLAGLEGVMEGLDAFSFSITPTCTATRPTHDAMQSFYNYLTAIMGPTCVPDLRLNIEGCTRYDTATGDTVRFPIKPLLRSPAWSRLQKAYLGWVYLDVEDLKKVKSMLRSEVRVIVNLDMCHFGVGSAAEIKEHRAHYDNFVVHHPMTTDTNETSIWDTIDSIP